MLRRFKTLPFLDFKGGTLFASTWKTSSVSGYIWSSLVQIVQDRTA